MLAPEKSNRKVLKTNFSGNRVYQDVAEKQVNSIQMSRLA